MFVGVGVWFGLLFKLFWCGFIRERERDKIKFFIFERERERERERDCRFVEFSTYLVMFYTDKRCKYNYFYCYAMWFNVHWVHKKQNLPNKETNNSKTSLKTILMIPRNNLSHDRSPALTRRTFFTFPYNSCAQQALILSSGSACSFSLSCATYFCTLTLL